MPKTEKTIPAYIPWATFTDFIKHLKGSGLVPSRIDKSLMGHLPSLTRGQLVTTLKFLGLIGPDGATGNGLLKQLVDAYETTTWAGALKQHVVPRYKEIIGDLKPDQATPQQLAERFRQACDKEMMRSKSERFYLALLTDAGVQFSPHLGKRAASQPSRPSIRAKKRGVKKITETPNGKLDENGTPPSGYMEFPLRDGRKITVPSALTRGDVKTITQYLTAFVGTEDE